jgi:hypothetical protein
MDFLRRSHPSEEVIEENDTFSSITIQEDISGEGGHRKTRHPDETNDRTPLSKDRGSMDNCSEFSWSRSLSRLSPADPLGKKTGTICPTHSEHKSNQVSSITMSIAEQKPTEAAEAKAISSAKDTQNTANGKNTSHNQESIKKSHDV